MTGTGAPRSKAQVDIGKTFKRNRSGCIWGHGWCPKWGDSLIYGAGPRLSLSWGSLREGERFVNIGSLALKRRTLLNENFQKYCKNYPRITCRWCSHGSPPSSSRTTVRIGNNLAEIRMILLTMMSGILKTWPEEGRLKQGKQIPSQNPTQLSLRLCCMARGRRSSGQPPCLVGGPALA